MIKDQFTKKIQQIHKMQMNLTIYKYVYIYKF